jgi:DNA-binding response OmpR family regulator
VASSRPILPPAPPLAGLGPARSTKAIASGDFAFDRPRVLVAEDNGELREFLVELLSTEYDVIPCADGVEALEAARRLRPDVILSDVMMPRLDGMGLVSCLKAEAALRHIPVVLLTAQASKDAAVAGLEGGADDYLGKPFSPAELRARLRVALRLARAYEREALRADELAETRDLVAQAAVSAFARKYAAALGDALRAPVARARALADELAGPNAVSGRERLRQALDELSRLADGLSRLSDPPPATSPPARLGLEAELRALAASLSPEVRARLDLRRAPGAVPDTAVSREDLRGALAQLIGAFARRRAGPITLELSGETEGTCILLSALGASGTPRSQRPAGLLELDLIHDDGGTPRPDFAFMLAKQLLHRNGASLRVEITGEGTLRARLVLPTG